MRFFHSVAQAHDAGSSATVLLSGGHNGKRIEHAIALAEALRTKVRESGIVFADGGNQAAEIEFGNTDWDKGVMRVSLRINLLSSPDEVNAALEKVGFIQGLPARF